MFVMLIRIPCAFALAHSAVVRACAHTACRSSWPKTISPRWPLFDVGVGEDSQPALVLRTHAFTLLSCTCFILLSCFALLSCVIYLLTRFYLQLSRLALLSRCSCHISCSWRHSVGRDTIFIGWQAVPACS